MKVTALLLLAIPAALLLLPGCATRTLSRDDRAKLAGKTFVITGASSGIAYWGHRLASHPSEYCSATAIKKAEIDMNPATALTPGNLHRPVDVGQDGPGGIRQRMQREHDASP